MRTPLRLRTVAAAACCAALGTNSIHAMVQDNNDPPKIQPVNVKPVEPKALPIELKPMLPKPVEQTNKPAPADQSKDVERGSSDPDKTTSVAIPFRTSTLPLEAVGNPASVAAAASAPAVEFSPVRLSTAPLEAVGNAASVAAAAAAPAEEFTPVRVRTQALEAIAPATGS